MLELQAMKLFKATMIINCMLLKNTGCVYAGTEALC